VRRRRRTLVFIGALLTQAGVVIAAPDDEPPLAPPEEEKADEKSSEPSELRAKLKSWGITGSARGAFWTSNRRSDDETNIGVGQFWAKLDRKLDKGLGVFAEGYLGEEDVFGYKRSTNRLREGYIDLRHNEWDFRLGKQIVAWGRTDRLNPTDNLTPRDFTLLDPEFDEDRFGSLAAKAAFNWGRGKSITAVWLPDFSPNVYAFTDAPSVTFQKSEPNSSRQFALKYDQSGGAFDWSVSYFDGFDLNPDLALASNSGGVQVISINYHRIKVVGADAATTVGPNRYALEAAYTRTEDSKGNTPGIKNPFFYGVIGLEHDFTNNLTGIVQYFYRHVFNYSSLDRISDPDARAVATTQNILNNQYDANQHGISARIGKKWFNETLEGEFAGATLLNRSGYSLRSKISYLWSDAIKLIGGYEYYSGTDKTSYGRLEKNKALFAEMRWFF